MDICVYCPHCKMPILIYKKDFNCKIFRHAVLKSTNKQINPHTKKEICDYLSKNNKIHGCGKPFKVIFNNENYIAVKCDYI